MYVNREVWGKTEKREIIIDEKCDFRGNKLNGVMPTILTGNSEDWHDKLFQNIEKKDKKTTMTMKLPSAYHSLKRKPFSIKDSILSKNINLKSFK